MNGDFVQAFEAVGLRDAVFDHDRIEVLHVGNADQLKVLLLGGTGAMGEYLRDALWRML